MGNGSLHGGEMSIRKKMGDRLWAIGDGKRGKSGTGEKGRAPFSFAGLLRDYAVIFQQSGCSAVWERT